MKLSDQFSIKIGTTLVTTINYCMIGQIWTK